MPLDIIYWYLYNSLKIHSILASIFKDEIGNIFNSWPFIKFFNDMINPWKLDVSVSKCVQQFTPKILEHTV